MVTLPVLAAVLSVLSVQPALAQAAPAAAPSPANTLAAALSAPANTLASGMGANAFIRDFFVDLTKASTINSLTKEPLTLDEEGWPKGDCRVDFPGGSAGYRTGHSPDVAGVYTLSFQCDNPDVQVVQTGAKNGAIAKTGYDAASKTWTGALTIPDADGKSCTFALQFKNTQTGIRHLRLLRPGYDLKTPDTAVHAPFKKLIAPFGGPFRPTSDQGQNTKPYPSWREWKDRPDLPYLPSPMSQNADGNLPSVEWQVALANELGRDLWINVPVNATDDYLTQMAKTIKEGSEYRGHKYAGLKPDLKLYVEYSNEVWNFGFYQTHWNRLAARAEMIAGNQDAPIVRKHDPSENHFDTDNAVRYAGRAAQVSRIFRTVFGEEQAMKRVRPVLGWQTNNGTTWQTMGEHIAQFYGPAESLFYGIGDAPYADPGRDKAETLDDMAAQTTEILDKWSKDHWRQSVAGARSIGLPYVCYEGGGFNAYSKPAKQIQYDWLYDPRLKDLTKRYWTDFFTAGGTELTWTGLHGPAAEGTGGAWGIVEDIYHPEESPRWLAVQELSTAPRPTPQTAATLDGSGPATVNIGDYMFQVESIHPLDRQKDAKGRAFASQPLARYTISVYVTKPGLYAVTLTGSHNAPGSDNSVVRVRCDGVAAAELTLPRGGDPAKDADWAKSSTPGVVRLEAGLHALQLRCDPAPRDGRRVQDLVIAPATELPKLPPSAPPAITAYSQKDRIVVAWEAAAHNGRPLTGYDVYRGDSADSEKLYKKGLPAGSLSFIDMGLKAGQTCSYHVVAVSDAGAGAASASVSTAPVEKPAAPTDLKAEVAKGSAPGTAKVTLTWDKAADTADYYAIYVSTKPGEMSKNPIDWWILAPKNSYVYASDASPWNQAGVKAPDIYFQVAAMNGAGQGARSAELHVDVSPALKEGQ
jgi:hypothetical protein